MVNTLYATNKHWLLFNKYHNILQWWELFLWHTSLFHYVPENYSFQHLTFPPKHLQHISGDTLKGTSHIACINSRVYTSHDIIVILSRRLIYESMNKWMNEYFVFAKNQGWHLLVLACENKNKSFNLAFIFLFRWASFKLLFHKCPDRSTIPAKPIQ